MVIPSSNTANSIKEYYFSKKLAAIRKMISTGKEIVNLGIGNPDIPPHNSVIQELNAQSSFENTHGYQSYRGIYNLRNAFAKWYRHYFNVSINPESEILPLQGSKSGIMYISQAFLNKDDKVLIPNPGYPAYATGANSVGAETMLYHLKKENQYLPDFEEIQKYDLSNVKLMWVNYPNMPTGKNASKGLFRKLIAFGKRNNILICNDNPYSFILNDKPLSILSEQNAFDTALELNSLSKSHNMAGWRIGAVFGAKEYIDVIQKIQSNFTSGMFLPVQKAAEKALNLNDEWYQNLNKIYTERIKYVWELADKLNLSYNKNSIGMFVWAEIPEYFKNSFEFSDLLLKKTGIFLTPGEIFGSMGKHYVRISLSNSIEDYKRALFLLNNEITLKN
ncbi:MAG: aminotransferase class I/II-fold pyridoxal phosphate-dependent enzyme [Chlorobi bacterium]|nr:aminotransferase class I/II-fold pyridoxal phosphate-dependent enzyme [Chlorobiota bacterium]